MILRMMKLIIHSNGQFTSRLQEARPAGLQRMSGERHVNRCLSSKSCKQLVAHMPHLSAKSA